MTFDWSKYKGGQGSFVKFENVGDSVTGYIVAIREHTFDKDKGAVPLLDLDVGGEEPVTLDGGRVDLRNKLSDLEPQVGDKLRVRFTGRQKTPNGSMMIFNVEHKVGERPAVAPAPVDDYEQYGEEPF